MARSDTGRPDAAVARRTRAPDRCARRVGRRRPRRYRPRRAECAEVFANRVHRARGGHAHLRLRRLHRRRRAAGHPGRAALLRPVHPARAPAHRPRGWEVVRFEGEFAPPQHGADDLTALAEAVREAGRADRQVEMPPVHAPDGAATCGCCPAGRRLVRGLTPTAERSTAAASADGAPPSCPDRRDGHLGPSRPPSPRRPVGSIKAYDVRGVVGEQIDAGWSATIGAAMARLLRDETPDTAGVVVGHDMRPSSPELAAAFADGVTAHGLDVVDIGLASTDMLYFASGALGMPGAMFTASHNPARYNGIKLCRAGARADRPGHRAGHDPRAPSSRACRRRSGTGGHRSRARHARRVRRLPAPAWSTCPRRGRCGSSSTPATAWPGTPSRGARRAAARRRADVLRARRHVPQPRGQPAGPGEPGRPAEGAWSPRAPTSGWPSTATPTAASSSTSAASR